MNKLFLWRQLYRTGLLMVLGTTNISSLSAEEIKNTRQRTLEYRIEGQGSFSSSRTPLWLNANKYGLSSLKSSNGYIRSSLFHTLNMDTLQKWDYGYGADIAVPFHFTSDFVVQQLYADLRFWHGTLTIGSKEYPAELKNNSLSSGSQTLGINARPVPQIRIALPQYWTLPFGKDWLHIKGHIAYGKYTDDNWQHTWTSRQSSYTDDVLYHSKAGYIKIGKKQVFPISLELGLEMAVQFGGTSYLPGGVIQKNKTNLGAYWNAFIHGGHDINETTYQNVEGNTVGSLMARLNFESEKYNVRLYADHFFEDHSGLFFLCKGGYGKDGNWEKRRFNSMVLYKLKDIMLGTEVELKNNHWLDNIVFEYLYTKYQSGPVYHDHTPQIFDNISGKDDYYNHGLYPGWQHWGQVMGNPLYRSPLYNTEKTISCNNNRFMALHLGISGNPLDNLHYRLLATYQQSLGTYDSPFLQPEDSFYGLAELSYIFGKKRKDWEVKGAFGFDAGKTLGNNRGFQLSIIKKGVFTY